MKWCERKYFLFWFSSTTTIQKLKYYQNLNFRSFFCIERDLLRSKELVLFFVARDAFVLVARLEVNLVPKNGKQICFFLRFVRTNLNRFFRKEMGPLLRSVFASINQIVWQWYFNELSIKNIGIKLKIDNSWHCSCLFSRLKIETTI